MEIFKLIGLGVVYITLLAIQGGWIYYLMLSLKKSFGKDHFGSVVAITILLMSVGKFIK